jgi:streptogramin lyase
MRVNSSIASWVRAVCLGFALLGLSSGAAQAQVVTEFSAGITAFAQPFGITAGPDGNVWFTEFFGNRIGRITPSGVVTEFSVGITAGAAPTFITAGPDGNLWFSEQNVGRIGRITPSGTVTEFSAGITAGASLLGITAGPDGNLWFTEQSSRIGRITTGTVIAPAPTIVKSFGAASIVLNGSTSLSFTINNPNTTLTGVGFADTLPAGLVVSTPNGLTGSCGAGTIVATAGSGAVSLTGATLAASASCTFSVNVTGTTAGTKNNTTGAMTSFGGGTGGTASASVTVGGAVVPPTIVKSFGAASIPLNGSTSLSFTINNPNASTTLTGVAFTDTLPAGLVISTPNGLTGSCGSGTITATAGSGSISLASATLASSGSCTFSVNVTGSSLGTQNNVTGAVASVEGGSGGTASASVTVAAGGATPTTNIPTLQPWALALLSLLLVLTGSVALRATR